MDQHGIEVRAQHPGRLRIVLVVLVVMAQPDVAHATAHDRPDGAAAQRFLEHRLELREKLAPAGREQLNHQDVRLHRVIGIDQNSAPFSERAQQRPPPVAADHAARLVHTDRGQLHRFLKVAPAETGHVGRERAASDERHVEPRSQVP